MPTYMKCARNYTLRSLTSHIIHFKKDEPTLVPDICVEEALAVNIIPCEGHAPEAAEAPAPKVLYKVNSLSAELRQALLLHAIDEIYREANPKDFDAGARPKANAISERAGVDISATERTKLWDKYRDIKAENGDLPRPKNFEMVVDAMRLNQKGALLAFGKDLGMDISSLAGDTLKEVKMAVVSAALAYQAPNLAFSELASADGETA